LSAAGIPWSRTPVARIIDPHSFLPDKSGDDLVADMVKQGQEFQEGRSHPSRLCRHRDGERPMSNSLLGFSSLGRTTIVNAEQIAQLLSVDRFIEGCGMNHSKERLDRKSLFSN
jgi:hypothetical protein